MKQGEDMKKIVLIGGEELAVNALRKAAEESGVQTVIVSAECADMKVSDVFEISADMRPSADEPEQGYMLMEGLTIEELTALLRRVKEAGEEYEGIKVMRTETNQHWPLSVLMSHTAAGAEGACSSADPEVYKPAELLGNRGNRRRCAEKRYDGGVFPSAERRIYRRKH